jgi:putative ABC transport system substrate-binding protein
MSSCQASASSVLINPNFPTGCASGKESAGSRPYHGSAARDIKANHDEELNAAFVSLLQERVGALFVGADPYFNIRRDRIVAFAAKQRLPAIWLDIQFSHNLMSLADEVIE